MYLIQEGRVEDVYAKYLEDNTSTHITDMYMNDIVPGSAGINSNHKYLDWIVDRWVKAQLDHPESHISE